MTRPSTLAVAAGAFGGLLLVAFFKGSLLGVLLGAMFSPLPLVMAALGLGSVYVPVAVISGAVTVMTLTASFAPTAMYLLVDAAPVAILARFFPHHGGPDPEGEVGRDLGRAVAALAIAAVLVMAASLAVLAPDAKDQGGLESALRSRMNELVAAAPLPEPAVVGGVDLAAARTEMVRKIAGLLPGAAAVQWSLRVLISAALGQWWLKRMGLALAATPAYRRVAVPGWVFILAGCAAVLGLVLNGDEGLIAANAAAALALAPVLQGLAVVHCATARLPRPGLALSAFYLLALQFPAIFAVGLAGAGVTDHFFKLRGRMAPQTGGE